MVVYQTAVAAKAPRKLAIAPPPTRVTPTSSKGKVSKRKSPGGGGNPVKIWPTPSWQKSIQSFFSQAEASKEGSSGSDNNSENDESFEGPSGSISNSEQCNISITTAPNVDTDSDSEE